MIHSVNWKSVKSQKTRERVRGNRFQKSVQPFDKYIQRNAVSQPGRTFATAKSFVANRSVAAKELTVRFGIAPARNFGIKFKAHRSIALNQRHKSQSLSPRRVLIVGNCSDGRRLAHEFSRHFPHAYTVVGLVTNEATIGEQQNATKNNAAAIQSLPVVGHISQIEEVSRQHQIDEVLIADYFAPEFKNWEEQALYWVTPAVSTRTISQGEVIDSSQSPDSISLNQHSQNSSALKESQLRDRLPNRKSGYHLAKRALDILISLVALIALMPLLLLMGLINKWTAPGPVLFTQERVGQNGRRFQIYKLRTMKLDAEKESGPVLAQHRDPRCTPLGAFLRATKIDELPQLYNVLCGDMSLVGPRPERPIFTEMYERYIPRYAERHQVRPGLTGWAQVKGDQLTHVNVKLHYDLAYVEKCSLTLDYMLLARTPLVILGMLFTKTNDRKKQPSLDKELKQSAVLT